MIELENRLNLKKKKKKIKKFNNTKKQRRKIFINIMECVKLLKHKINYITYFRLQSKTRAIQT